MTGHDELFEAKADVRTDEQEVLAQADAAQRPGRTGCSITSTPAPAK